MWSNRNRYSQWKKYTYIEKTKLEKKYIFFSWNDTRSLPQFYSGQLLTKKQWFWDMYLQKSSKEWHRTFWSYFQHLLKKKLQKDVPTGAHHRFISFFGKKNYQGSVWGFQKYRSLFYFERFILVGILKYDKIEKKKNILYIGWEKQGWEKWGKR